MVCRFDANRQLGQVSEYRLVWNPAYFQKKKRIFREESITNAEFLAFIKNSAKIITLQLVSLHVIVLKDPVPQLNNFMRSRRDQDGKITGVEWWSSKENDRIVIPMGDIVGGNMNIKSDLTESQYTLYKNDAGEQVAFHIQTTLTLGLRELMKSPWQRSLHIIDSIFDTQPNFKHFVEKRKIYGVSAQFILRMMAKMNDCPSFDQNDR